MKSEFSKIDGLEKNQNIKESEKDSFSPEKLDNLCTETESELESMSNSLITQTQGVLDSFPEINGSPEHESLLELKQEVLDLQKDAQNSIAWVKQKFNLDKAAKEYFLDIEIQGTKEFRKKVMNALSFLSLAPEKLKLSQQNIGRIQEWGHSGMNVFKDKPTFEIGDMWKDSDEIYLASGIAHDAYHSYLCKNSQDDAGNIYLGDFIGKDAEKKCLAVQIETLDEIKNSEYLKDYTHQQEAIQYCIDELKEIMINPTYQDIPYDERNW